MTARLAPTALAVVLATGASAQNLVISNWDGYMAPDAVATFTA